VGNESDRIYSPAFRPFMGRLKNCKSQGLAGR
jgi:hypothetical protein